jgi:hypothetical protein
MGVNIKGLFTVMGSETSRRHHHEEKTSLVSPYSPGWGEGGLFVSGFLLFFLLSYLA